MPRSKTTSDLEILLAANRALQERGPEQLTLAAIATEAGLAPATLLQRFGTKQRLLSAAAQASCANADAAFKAARTKHKRAIDALRAGLVATAGGSRRAIANGIASELAQRDERTRVAATTRAMQVERAIRALLEAAMQQRDLPKQPAAPLARLLYAAYRGAVLDWALGGSGTARAHVTRVLAPLLPRDKKR